MELFGIIIPLWAVFLGGILVVIIAWKLIKFALKLLLVLVVFFAILIGLDFFGVFNWIQGLFISLPAF
jgi:hypothetical protein